MPAARRGLTRLRSRGSPPTAAPSSRVFCSSPCLAPSRTAPSSSPAGAGGGRRCRDGGPRAGGARGRRARSGSRHPPRASRLAAASFYKPASPRPSRPSPAPAARTSVAAFTRQIWATLGHQAASMGTIGLVTPDAEAASMACWTTPDPVDLHRTLDEIAGVPASPIWRWKRRRTASTSIASTACASPSRASPTCRAITSTISLTFEAYLAAKPHPVRADRAVAGRRRRHRRRQRRGRDRDRRGAPAQARRDDGRPQRRRHPSRRGRDRRLRPDPAARACGADPTRCVSRWSADSRSRTRWWRPAKRSRAAASQGRRVRRARAARRRKRPARAGRGRRSGAPIFVDYAHKPDALAKAIEALRPYVKRPPRGGARRRRRPRPRQAAADGADAIAAEKADRA